MATSKTAGEVKTHSGVAQPTAISRAAALALTSLALPNRSGRLVLLVVERAQASGPKLLLRLGVHAFPQHGAHGARAVALRGGESARRGVRTGRDIRSADQQRTDGQFLPSSHCARQAGGGADGQHDGMFRSLSAWQLAPVKRAAFAFASLRNSCLVRAPVRRQAHFAGVGDNVRRQRPASVRGTPDARFARLVVRSAAAFSSPANGAAGDRLFIVDGNDLLQKAHGFGSSRVPGMGRDRLRTEATGIDTQVQYGEAEPGKHHPASQRAFGARHHSLRV